MSLPDPGAGAHSGPSVFNAANIVTFARLALVPLLAVALALSDKAGMMWRWLPAILFTIAALTDQLDGWLARKYDLVTDLGKIVDPIADKALVGTAIIGLSLRDELPWWVTIIILTRELGVTLLRWWVIHYEVIPASRGGKLKTLVQMGAILLFLLPLPATVNPWSWTVMSVAVVLTVVTGLDYVRKVLQVRQGREVDSAP